METDKSDMTNRDDSNAKENHEDKDHRFNSEEAATSKIGGFDRDVSGNDIGEEGVAQRRHQQQYGNRKYESYKNHSSADDQPMNDSGA